MFVLPNTILPFLLIRFITMCRSIPLEERSRAVAFVFGGLSVGSVLGYANV